MNNKSKILLDKRIADLTCLGLDAYLYFNICKFIDRRVYTVLKDGVLLLFPVKGLELYKDGRQHITYSDIAERIYITYSLKEQYVSLVITEWRRDKIIYHNMSKDMVKYWDYMVLPLYNVESDKDEYNF